MNDMYSRINENDINQTKYIGKKMIYFMKTSIIKDNLDNYH